MMLITAVFSLRSFSMFGIGSNEVGAVLFSKFGLIAWYVMCLVNHVFCFMASNSYSGLPRFFILLEQLCALKDIETNEAWIRKLVVIVVAGFAWPATLIFTGMWIYVVIYQVEWMALPFAPVSVNSPDLMIMQIIYILLSPLYSALQVFPASLDFIICISITATFNK